MREDDITPPAAMPTCPVEHLGKHRPYMTVGVSMPLDPTRPTASAHVHTKEFPDLEQSPNVGVGGLVGTRQKNRLF